MEGTWGRRVHGAVREDKEAGETNFALCMLMDSTTILSCRITVETVDLEEDPYLYGVVLDWMVEDMDAKLATYLSERVKK